MSEYDVIANELKHINNKLDDMCKDMVTQQEFRPVRNIAFGFVALIMVGVITALLSLIIRSNVQAEGLTTWLMEQQVKLMG